MTDPASGAPARASSSSIEQGLFLDIDGMPQWVTLRGADLANPALMILTGPGAAFSRLAPFFAPWERELTLVQWDQPGGGSTWARSGDVGELSYARLVRDGVAVAEQALARLGARRLVLLGVSGGSILGLMMLKARPDLFSAYVGTGQIVDWARQETLSYQAVLSTARARGEEAAVAELEGIGPPPYAQIGAELIKTKYAGALTPAELAVVTSLDPPLMAPPPAGASWIPDGLPAHDPRERGMAVYQAMRAEIAAFDAYALGRRFEAPVVFLQGAEDAYTVPELVREYADWIEAPAKAYVEIEGGGHSALFLRERFLELLVRHVRPLAT